jgi:hypothetical protein
MEWVRPRPERTPSANVQNVPDNPEQPVVTEPTPSANPAQTQARPAPATERNPDSGAGETREPAVPLPPEISPPGVPPDTFPPRVELSPPVAGRGLRPRAGRVLGAGVGALVTTLRSLPPETYDLVYASNDAEARSMALQIRGLLESVGWKNESTTEVPEPAATLGIFAPRVTAGISHLTNWATRAGLKPDARRVPTLPRLRIVVGKQQ